MENPVIRFEFYAEGAWRSFSREATVALEAALADGLVTREVPGNRKAKSERRIRRPRTHTRDGTAIDWSDEAAWTALRGTDLWDLFLCSASLFKRMRKLEDH